MAPCGSGTAEPLKGQRFRPCWLTCFCITQWTHGWSGSSRPWNSSVTQMTRCSISRRSYQARKVRDALAVRLESLGLRLHPGKTKIVYCKDANGRRSHEHTSFTFLGYEFRPRSAENRNGQLFTTFSPAIGPDALKAKGQQVREWRIHKRVGSDLAELAAWINPVVRGWMNYYGRFNRSRLYRLLQRINTYIVRWARNKYRRLGSFKKAKRWWDGLVDREPGLFAHWAWISTF